MKDRDFLWCLVHGLLDREEALEGLCPTCRSQAGEEKEACPVCGRPRSSWGEGAVNSGFDEERFQTMRGGVNHD